MLQKKENIIFLVSPQILDESSFCNYVKKTAEKNALSVFLLMLASNYQEEANGHLKLISITSALVGHSFHVDSQLVFGNSWIEAIQKYSHPDDVVYCPKEIQAVSHIFFRQPLADQLVRKYQIPFKYTLHWYVLILFRSGKLESGCYFGLDCFYCWQDFLKPKA
jgi:hypothetical protein